MLEKHGDGAEIIRFNGDYGWATTTKAPPKKENAVGHMGAYTSRGHAAGGQHGLAQVGPGWRDGRLTRNDEAHEYKAAVEKVRHPERYRGRRGTFYGTYLPSDNHVSGASPPVHGSAKAPTKPPAVEDEATLEEKQRVAKLRAKAAKSRRVEEIQRMMRARNEERIRMAAEEQRKHELLQAVRRRAERSLALNEALAPASPPDTKPTGLPQLGTAGPDVPRLPTFEPRQASTGAPRSADASPRPASASDSPRRHRSRSSSPRHPRKHRASSSSPRRADRPFQPHINRPQRDESQQIVSIAPARHASLAASARCGSPAIGWAVLTHACVHMPARPPVLACMRACVLLDTRLPSGTCGRLGFRG